MTKEEMPYHGIEHCIETPAGMRTITARIEAEILQNLVDSYAEVGNVAAASRAVGLSRRTAHRYLDRLGVLDRNPKLQSEKITYTDPITENTITTLYPCGMVRKAAELYRQNYTTREIADRLDVAAYTVWSWMDGLCIARSAHVMAKHAYARRKGFDSRTALRREVQRLRNHNATVEQIAHTLGMSRHMVSCVLDTTRGSRKRVDPTYGDYKPGGGADPDAVRKRQRHVVEMDEEGVPPQEIAHQLGVSTSTVYNDLNAMTEAA